MISYTNASRQSRDSDKSCSATLIHQDHLLQILQDLLPSNLTLPSRQLCENLVGDVLIGTTVTAAVSPALTVIDKAVVERAAGKTLVESAASSLSQMVRHPVQYLRSPTFKWMWMTYAATYITANTLKTICVDGDEDTNVARRTTNKESAAAEPSSAAQTTIFLGTTFANTSACLAKDTAYAKLFGNSISASVPMVSYGLWMLRDLTVIGSSFVLPDYIAPALQSHFDLSKERAVSLAQVATPMASQIVGAPLHLAGLDCFNRPLAGMSRRQCLLERSRFLAQNYGSVLFAKTIRILPGFGVCGVYNRHLRDQWRQATAQRALARSVRSGGTTVRRVSTITITSSY